MSQNKDYFQIYHLKDDDNLRQYRFSNYRELESNGLEIQANNYELVYQGELKDGMNLDTIYNTFNIDRPDDYYFHSLSVGDIVALNKKGKEEAFFVDSFSFKLLPNFMEEIKSMQKSWEDGAWELKGYGFLFVQESIDGWDYTIYDQSYEEIDGGQLDEPNYTLAQARVSILNDFDLLQYKAVSCDVEDFKEIVYEKELIGDVKMAIIQWGNREYDQHYTYKDFDELYPDVAHIPIAYTTTEDGNHEIQCEINLDDLSFVQYFDDKPITKIDYLKANGDKEEALLALTEEMKYGEFDDFVSIDYDDLKNELGLEIDDDGNIYDPQEIDFNNQENEKEENMYEWVERIFG